MCFNKTSISAALEANGFKRKIASDEDFNAAVEAIITMRETNRGIIIAGKYGVGKTCLARAIVKIFGRGNFRSLMMYNQSDVDFLKEDAIDYWAGVVYEKGVFLDDLGAEKPVNNFGVVQEVIGDFIVLYHLYGLGVMIITTNLSVADIDTRYGGRVHSRIKDKCIPLLLKGNDKRQWLTTNH